MILKIYELVDECKLKHNPAVAPMDLRSDIQLEEKVEDITQVEQAMMESDSDLQAVHPPASFFMSLYEALEKHGEEEYRQHWDGYLWNATRIALGQEPENALVVKGFVA